MARKARTAHYPLNVTGVLRSGGTVPDLVVADFAEVRAFLLPGTRLTDGVVVPSGWSDLICSTCGDSAAWCPDLSAALTAEQVETLRAS